jgi:hypothetical protein
LEDIAYQRSTIGFLTPEAREKWNEPLRGGGDVGPSDIAEAPKAGEVGSKGQGPEATEG